MRTTATSCWWRNCAAFAPPPRAFRSQPALSLSIREMEQRLGQPLFERGNGNALTRFGQDCLPLARELVEHHDRVAGTLAGLAGNEAGTLTMASVATVAMHWLPELVAAYRERYPGWRCACSTTTRRAWNAWCWRARWNWGVQPGAARPAAGVRAAAARRIRAGLPSRPSLAGRKSVTWREIAGLPLVGTVAHRQLADYPQAAFMMERQVFVSNMMSLLAMLERGVGVTVLARLGVPPDSPGLVFVPLARPRIERELGITRLAGRHLSPAAARMEEMLRAKAARGGRSVA
ncbi:LysR substrate-binding domain-containing protein [Achromobacter xylosoxidans]